MGFAIVAESTAGVIEYVKRSETTSILYWLVFMTNLESFILVPVTPLLGCIAAVCKHAYIDIRAF